MKFYKLRFPMSGLSTLLINFATSMLEVRKAVAAFSRSVESYRRNREATVRRGWKLTKAPGGAMLPTYQLRVDAYAQTAETRLVLPTICRRTCRSLNPRARNTHRKFDGMGKAIPLRWKKP